MYYIWYLCVKHKVFFHLTPINHSEVLNVGYWNEIQLMWFMYVVLYPMICSHIKVFNLWIDYANFGSYDLNL